MLERLYSAPWSIWISLIALSILTVEAVRRWNAPWSKPCLAVYVTVLFWYIGDFLVSEKIDFIVFPEEIVSIAFFQVGLFLLCFRIAVGPISRRFCAKPIEQMRQLRQSGRIPKFAVSSRLLAVLLTFLIIGWLAIFLIGASLSPDVWPALIWPPLQQDKVTMYPLARVGGGASFLFNALAYVHVLICALFGVLAVMARGPVRWIAVAMICITWPYFLFDRYRSKMLALILPGFIALLILGKTSAWIRVSTTAVFSIVLAIWFAKVMDYRTDGRLTVFKDTNSLLVDEDMRLMNAALGQDMLKELCWINMFLETGRITPSLGSGYLAELVNPIPRSLWPGKPLVGVDYAMARGFSGRREATDVFATISTGMIGQGCVNFGRFFGVIASALIFALWAAYLSRLWCQRSSPYRLALFLVGLGLTLNTGRDFTFLVLFPFVFGYAALRLYEHIRRPTHVWRPARPANSTHSESRASLSERTSDFPLDP